MALRTDRQWLKLNARVIEEFRANGGQCGGPFEGNPMVLLTTTGARSGQLRVSPVTYTMDGDRWILIASKAGADAHPAWYYNLVANRAVILEVGTERFAAIARAAEEPERSRLYAERVEAMPRFGGYATETSREIPVVIISRLPG